MNPDVPLPVFSQEQGLHINNVVDKILDSVPNSLRDYARDALTTIRYPNGKNKEGVTLPTSESIREQLLTLLDTHFNGDVDKLLKCMGEGFVAKLDGVKTQNVSQMFGEAVGDAYIAGNVEIALKVANEVDYHVVGGIYSGDENIGLKGIFSCFSPQDLAWKVFLWRKGFASVDTVQGA